ncbi:MAG: metallophosphoesterase [Myxococcota bacterium]
MSPQQTLVISDLHLGARRADPSLDAALISFVDHYLVEPGPWRLIIAGDGIDFVHAGLEATGPERDHCEARAVHTLERIVNAHLPVFSALARFVSAGHELIFLKGNHDAELHWDAVQSRLRQLFEELGAGEGSRDRILVHPWFYYVEDELYVEHGNQYDPLCSFEHVLWPVDADHRIAAPLSHVALQTFSGLIHRLDAHAVDRWRLPDFLRWLRSLEPALIWRSAGAYLGCSQWLGRLKRRLAKSTEEARVRHQARLRELVAHFRLRPEAVERLDRLRHRPAGHRLISGFRMLFFDQLLLAGATAALLMVLLVLGGPLWPRLATGGGLLIGAALLSQLWLRWRSVDPAPALAERAAKVADLVGVPYVVFGHSHAPLMQPLPAPGSAYVNSGSWTHVGATGLTHVVVTHGAARNAELRRWNPREGTAEAVASWPKVHASDRLPSPGMRTLPA